MTDFELTPIGCVESQPNPIGLHRVEVVEVQGRRLRVRNLEAVDGTPIIDMKAVLHEDIGRR